MIKVVHTVNAFTATSGGTSTCVYDLLSAINTRDDVHADIIVTKPDKKLMGYGEPWILPVEYDEKTPFGFSANLRDALQQTNADIYHTNGLWRYCNHLTATIARQKNKPFVFTPHGMLYPQALAISKWKKQLLRWTIFDKDIRGAACIHVTCEKEMEYIRALGFSNPVAIIGNPVPEIDIKHTNRSEKVTFGYLGRLHPRKKVERLIDAFANLTEEERNQCELVIIGSGEHDYEMSLQSKVSQLKIQNIRFLGFVEGEEKLKQLARLSALFVPSDYENFGMIISETLSCGTPVWASTGTPWKLLNECKCGWWQEPNVENIIETMREILTMGPKKLDEMGEIGRKVVQEHFASQVVAQQMSELYKWILTKQSKPSFVYE